MPLQAKRMPFLEHFAELRKRITVCVLVLAALTAGFYTEHVYKFLMALLFRPLSGVPGLGFGKLITNGPFEAMTMRFQLGFYAALVISSPLILFEIFAFFSPALKARERRWIFPTIATAIVLFLSGVTFSYLVIMPKGFEWLAQQGAGVTHSLPKATEYLSGIGMMLIGFGISFELPLVVFYLIGMGILPYQKVRDSWRVAYIIIVIVAAIATPDWSPYPMFGLSAALILLFEGSLLAARIVFKRKVDEQAVDAYQDQQLYNNEATDDPEELKKREKLRKRAEAAAQRIPLSEKEDDTNRDD